MRDRISVIIPVYNGAEFLPESLESIFTQRCQPFEIIVVDDGSEDHSRAVAEQYVDRLIYVRQEHQGPSSARNHGLALASGELIGFLDVDDLWLESTLETLAAPLAGASGIDFVFGRSRLEWLSETVKAEDHEWSKRYLDDRRSFPVMGNFLVRRSVFDRVAGFDPELWMGEDTDWFVRLKESGIRTRALEHVVHMYRRHLGSSSRKRGRADVGWAFHIIKKSLDRRRAGSGAVAPLPDIFTLADG